MKDEKAKIIAPPCPVIEVEYGYNPGRVIIRCNRHGGRKHMAACRKRCPDRTRWSCDTYNEALRTLRISEDKIVHGKRVSDFGLVAVRVDSLGRVLPA